MIATDQKDWKQDFGLDGLKPPYFFSSVDQLDEAGGKVSHPHTLRRAFEHLGIEGILCQEHSPIIYFRQVRKVDSTDIITLHRSFWNQGIAPILVIIAPDEVHVYSGLIPPENTLTKTRQAPGLVERLNRVKDKLRSFLLSVESGEYFHVHRHSFDPSKRVDRDLLRNLDAARQKLGRVQATKLDPQTLDALLCRLVFTCYLFDRGIIDQDYLKALRIQGAKHLKDVLTKKNRTDTKADLYKLFDQLGNHFNGDLFTADLKAESKQIKDEHLDILDRFFHGTDVRTGQQPLWPYDFSFIPIETISAIYEHFLKAAGESQKKEAGAFYTPRFLAEFILDVALEGETSLLDKRFLDPACGSGIFLVGLFNRLAEEWKLKNPGARYDRRANGLMDILRTNLHGVDSNRSACQITAFSLYLAFLDQLSPPDIQKLLGKWDRLPYLVSIPGETNTHSPVGTIHCIDFFAEEADLPKKIHIIVGNPPWGPVKKSISPTAAEIWCARNNLKHPNREKSVPFIWKAPIHLVDGGKACFVLPHGILFNHNDTAIRFQRSLFRIHAIDRVVNLTDYRFFLFEESLAPALIIRYHKEKPTDNAQLIDYWAPKTDRAVRQAEIVSVLPQDRSRFTVREVLEDLKGDDAPLIWKQRFWATPRDWRLLDRLLLLPRLRDIVGQPRRGAAKRWMIAEGFQPFGANDQPSSRKTLQLPTRSFIEASYPGIDLFILPGDCKTLPSNQIETRRLIRNTSIFEAPHVLVSHGFSRVAFADFDVSFRHALRGIHGPKSDRELLIFLAAYLRSKLARFFLFHTSSNWGVYRPEVHVEELLRLPFPLPEDTHNPKRCQAIVREVAAVATKAAQEASRDFADREGIVRRTQEPISKLIEEYFDIDKIERMLIADTTKIIIPSIQPSRGKSNVPTIKQSSDDVRASYTSLLCDRLNAWSTQEYKVHGKTMADSFIGVGMVVLEKTRREEKPTQPPSTDGELLKAIYNLQRIAAKGRGTFELVRGLKVFHKNLLYITKPLGQRFWTNTAALNDADEIAATILTRTVREEA
jgi:type I restriction-modification system DNA methylase subunit